jgi:hypothetical protein
MPISLYPQRVITAVATEQRATRRLADGHTPPSSAVATRDRGIDSARVTPAQNVYP